MNITKAEHKILSALWLESPLTVGQVIERVQEDQDWHDNTIKTLLTRLLEKGAIERAKDGRRYFYSPLISRKDVVEKEATGLLNKFFNGQMAPLVAHFADQKKLSKKDIAEIEQILKSLKNNDD